MDKILIILKKKENGPRASSAPALGLNTIIFKYVYWYMKQISGERLQDHWSSGCYFFSQFELSHFSGILTMKVNGQWVPCVRNSSYSLIQILLKLYRH